jgi:hypothetical protein
LEKIKQKQVTINLSLATINRADHSVLNENGGNSEDKLGQNEASALA